MAQIIVNFSINEDVKSKMESACKEMGLSLSTAFNIFAVKVGNERRIPFQIVADTFYSESNMRVLEERAANIESGKSIPKEHELIEVQYMEVLQEDEAWQEYVEWQEQIKNVKKDKPFCKGYTEESF